MPAFDAVIENSTNTLHLELVRASVVAGNDSHIGLENKNFYIKKDRFNLILRSQQNQGFISCVSWILDHFW